MRIATVSPKAWLKVGVLLSTSALTAAWPTLAAAQSSSAASAAAPANADIIVTATKRSESLQNVPISIQALGAQTLQQHQVASFDDYAKLLPSVSYQSFGPGQSQLYFRGIATGGDGLHAGPLPATGVYFDEVPVTTIANNIDIHAYDIARVEALSGPQGTLYGASSLSGTLRIITNKPDPTKFSAGFDLTGDKYGKGTAGGTAEGFVNIPLSSVAALRVVGFYERDGGYIDNLPTVGRTFCNADGSSCTPNQPYQRYHYDDNGNLVASPYTTNNIKYAKNNFNSVDTYGGRAALKYDIDENWSVTPSVIYQHQIARGTFLYDPKVGDLDVHDFAGDVNKDRWVLPSLTVQGKLSDWDVTYAGSYFHRVVDNVSDYSYFTVAYDQIAYADPADYAGYTYLKDANGNDIDPTQYTVAKDTYTKQSHELRVSSPSTDRLRLTAGMFFQRQTDNQFLNYVIPGVSTAVNAFDPQVPGAPTDDVYYTHLHRTDRDYAMFGEASYDILPNLTLSAGIRGFIAKNTLTGFSGGISAVGHVHDTTGCEPETVEACPDVNGKYVQSGETHKANLTWKIDRDHMVYFTYSTGFRPGGINRPVFNNGNYQNIPDFAADTLTNYEVGWKTSWWDHRLRVNGALFWEDWNKVQYSEPGILGIYYTVNAGSARSRGVEGDISVTPFRGLTLSASGTYVDAKLTSDFSGTDSDGNIVPLAPKGTRLPVTPKLKFNATARYDFMTGDLKDFIQAGINHQSGTTQYLTTAGEALIGPTQGFTTFDFSGGTSFKNITISAFIQNAFDKRGILSKNIACAPSFCAAYERSYPIKPQYFGIKLGERF